MKNGFTLTEVLIVIAIIGIISVATIPAIRFYQPNIRLSGAARELVTDLRYIQQITVTEQVEHCIQFFPLEKKYQIIQCQGSEVLEEKTLPTEIQTMTVTGFTQDIVRYNPYGAVQKAGTIVLENTRNEIKTILVKPSGFIEITY